MPFTSLGRSQFFVVIVSWEFLIMKALWIVSNAFSASEMIRILFLLIWYNTLLDFFDVKQSLDKYYLKYFTHYIQYQIWLTKIQLKCIFRSIFMSIFYFWSHLFLMCLEEFTRETVWGTFACEKVFHLYMYIFKWT